AAVDDAHPRGTRQGRLDRLLVDEVERQRYRAGLVAQRADLHLVPSARVHGAAGLTEATHGGAPDAATGARDKVRAGREAEHGPSIGGTSQRWHWSVSLPAAPGTVKGSGRPPTGGSFRRGSDLLVGGEDDEVPDGHVPWAVEHEADGVGDVGDLDAPATGCLLGDAAVAAVVAP